MKILGIETSCDETAVSILKGHSIMSNKVFSQISIHKKFGGVVPEIAARNHVDVLPYIINNALKEANISLEDLDCISATGGPGLISGLMVGVMYAKTIASSLSKKFIAINHLEGHLLTPRLTDQTLTFPYLAILLSGGHCQIISVEGIGKYKLLSTTIDDAIGESFDKVAKMLNIGYPGGPAIEKYAQNGNKYAYKFPKPMLNSHNFSFSGLKTSVRNLILKKSSLIQQDIADISASFQYTVSEILKLKISMTIKKFSRSLPDFQNIILSGGVASNSYIRKDIEKFSSEIGCKLILPPPHLCTDNAAMIAFAAGEKFKLGLFDDITFTPRPRWNIEDI